MRKIGFIGLGAMGLPMAANLARRQMPIVGFDVRASSIAKLEDEGGRGAPSVKEAANGADVLVLMLVNADQVDQVLFEGGTLDVLAPDATVIVMATCAPARVAAMAARVEATGRGFIDAPVSGGVVGATAGSLTIMAAAPTPVFAKYRPLLEALGSKLFHVGETPGQGAAMKTVNQLLCGVHIAAAAEGLALAGPRMVADDGAVTSALDIFVKDLGIVLDAGRAERMGLPLSAAAHQLFLAASGFGLGARDDSQVIELYRALRRPKNPAE